GCRSQPGLLRTLAAVAGLPSPYALGSPAQASPILAGDLVPVVDRAQGPQHSLLTPRVESLLT
ncbi:MAG: hypothetical protein ACRDZ0_14835, partial [Acidimicrobiales bacterium]